MINHPHRTFNTAYMGEKTAWKCIVQYDILNLMQVCAEIWKSADNIRE